MLLTYTHLATEAAPATVQRYVFQVEVFRYISPTTAEATPEPLKMVAVVDVPVIPVPEYHLPPAVPVCPGLPSAPLMHVLVEDCK